MKQVGPVCWRNIKCLSPYQLIVLRPLLQFQLHALWLWLSAHVHSWNPCFLLHFFHLFISTFRGPCYTPSFHAPESNTRNGVARSNNNNCWNAMLKKADLTHLNIFSELVRAVYMDKIEFLRRVEFKNYLNRIRSIFWCVILPSNPTPPYEYNNEHVKSYRTENHNIILQQFSLSFEAEENISMDTVINVPRSWP